MRTAYDFLANTLERYLNFDARYFLRGGFWLTLSQGITIIFGIATTALLAHFLTETNYGIYRYLLSIAALLSVFSLTGLGQAVLQAAAKKYYNFYLETLKTNFIYSLFITIFSFIGAGYYWLNENVVLAIGCVLIAITVPAINTFQLTPSFLYGSQRFKQSTVAQTIKTVIVSVSTLVVIVITQNILWLLFAYLLSSALAGYIIHLTYRPTAIKLTPPEIKQKYITYAKHTSVRNIIGGIANRLDTIIVFTQLGAIELAVYSIATIIPEQIKGSFKNLATLILPKYANQDVDSIKKSIPKRSVQLFFVFLLITIVYILAAPYLYGFLFPKYDNAVFYSQIISLSLPAAIAIIPLSLLQTQRKDKELHLLTIYESITTVILLFTLTYFFGLIGTIMARVISRFLALIYCLFLIDYKSSSIT